MGSIPAVLVDLGLAEAIKSLALALEHPGQVARAAAESAR